MFASNDVARKQSLGGTALQNSRDMQMTRYRRCRDTIAQLMASSRDNNKPPCLSDQQKNLLTKTVNWKIIFLATSG